MSPYNYSNIYYNDGSTLTSPGQSPSPSPPNSHGKKHVYKMENVPTPQMSPMEMNENVHSSKIDYEQALPATTTNNYNSNKNHSRYSYDTSNSYETAPKNAYHYVSNESQRMYENHQMSQNNLDKKSAYNMPLTATTATTIAAMGNGMYVMCSNRGVLDQGHIVTGTYFPPLPTSQDHQNLGTNSILTSSSHHHYMNTTQTTSSLVGNQIMSGNNGGNSNDVKFKSNDSNNNKHGSENNNNNNNNKTNKMNDMNNGKNEGKNGGGNLRATSKDSKSNNSNNNDDIDDKLIKNDTNNNNHPDNKNGSSNNRLILSSPSSSAPALSPYHHQSYLSQYKNHLNYSDHTTTAVISQSQMQDEVGDGNKYGNFTTAAEYDPYHHQNNPIYYHPTAHFTHPSLNTLPPSSVASPTTFYVTNPEYYHQSYTMASPSNIQTSTAPTTTTLVQPMVAKIDAVIGATALHHPSQTLIQADPYVVNAEQMKEDDFSNILAGVRKTCYSN